MMVYHWCKFPVCSKSRTEKNEGGHFVPPPHDYKTPKKPMINRVNSHAMLIFVQYSCTKIKATKTNCAKPNEARKLMELRHVYIAKISYISKTITKTSSLNFAGGIPPLGQTEK